MKQFIFFKSLLFTTVILFTSLFIIGCTNDSIQTLKFNCGSTTTVLPIMQASTTVHYLGESLGGSFIIFHNTTRKHELISLAQDLILICRIDIQSLIKQTFFIPLFIACCITVFKTVHYRKLFADKNKWCWFYFAHYDIMLSLNDTRRKAKVIQNVLSIILFINLSLLIITIAYLFL